MYDASSSIIFDENVALTRVDRLSGILVVYK